MSNHPNSLPNNENFPGTKVFNLSQPKSIHDIRMRTVFLRPECTDRYGKTFEGLVTQRRNSDILLICLVSKCHKVFKTDKMTGQLIYLDGLDAGDHNNNDDGYGIGFFIISRRRHVVLKNVRTIASRLSVRPMICIFISRQLNKSGFQIDDKFNAINA